LARRRPAQLFKVELRTSDDRSLIGSLVAGNSLDKARALFAAYGKRRPTFRSAGSSSDISIPPPT
jgi:hypothetical protein